MGFSKIHVTKKALAKNINPIIKEALIFLIFFSLIEAVPKCPEPKVRVLEQLP
jgi:hypothetical protein